MNGSHRPGPPVGRFGGACRRNRVGFFVTKVEAPSHVVTTLRSIGNPHEISGHVHAQRCRRHAGGALARRCIAPPDAGATGLHLSSCAASQRHRKIVRPRPAYTHRRSDMILSNCDFAFCGFPSRAGTASRVDAAHDPAPEVAPAASFGVMRRRNGRAGGGRALPVLAEQDKCRCRICASVCRNSSAHGSFFWQPLRHALMV